MLRSASLRDELRIIKPSRRAAAIECRHLYNKIRCGVVSGLTRNDTPNDFGEDADQFLTRRRDSTGAEICTRHHLSRSLSSNCVKLAALNRASSAYKLQLQSIFHDRPQTYYPLHQGPSITVSSADGTTLYADNESDTQRNAAAQSLFRALTRHNTKQRLKTLDGHMHKIFGRVELDLEIKNMNALNGVDVSDCEWEIQSMHAAIEGENKKKIRKRPQRIKDTWDGWVARIFGWYEIVSAEAYDVIDKPKSSVTRTAR